MVVAHCSTAFAATSLPLRLVNAAPIPRKPPLLVSSISTPPPSKLTKRKNYLRPKLLKTLRKPYPNPILPESPPPTNPTIVIEYPLEQQPEFPSDQLFGEELKEAEFREFSLSETSSSAGLVDGSVNFSTRSVLKIGLYLVGAFLFQTIFAVWVLGSADSDSKDGSLRRDDKAGALELGLHGNNKSKFLLNGNVNSLDIREGGIVNIDESEMNNKIVAIQLMAREARRREKLESKGNGLEEENDHIIVKTGIEKEVDSRLINLQKSLQNSYEKSPLLSSGNFLRKDGKVEDRVDKEGLDAKEAIEALMFKKKYTLKSPSIDSRDKPKGFGLRARDVTKMKSSSLDSNEALRSGSIDDNGVDLLDQYKRIDLPNGDVPGNVSMPLEVENGRNSPAQETKPIRTPRKKESARTKRGVAKTESGTSQENRYGKPAVRAVKSRKSSKSQNYRGVTKENQDATKMSNKFDDLNRNGSLKGRKVGNKKLGNKLGDKKSYAETDFWWLSLPYVLAILMQRGRDGEGPEGLFTLRSATHTTGEASYTVTFEDRGDATNFSYLLESFFEDLSDFNADIVPIPIKDLEEAVKSQIMKVLVVKKGQLQLYAGQPLTDVEMALRSLVGQD